MYATVSHSTPIDGGYFDVAHHVTGNGTHRVDLHLDVHTYLALSPDEARQLHGALGRVLTDLDAQENATDGTGPDDGRSVLTDAAVGAVDANDKRGVAA